MKKGVITTLALLVITPTIILFVFGVGGDASAYTNKGSHTLSDYMENYISADYKIGVEKPTVNTYENNSYYSELVSEQDMFVPNEIRTSTEFNLEADEFILANSDLDAGLIQVAHSTPVELRAVKVDQVSVRITDMIEAALENTKNTDSPDIVVNTSLSQAYRYEPVQILAEIKTENLRITNALMFIRLESDKMAKKNGDDRYYINVFKNAQGQYYGVYLHPFGGKLGDYSAVFYIQTREGNYAYTKKFTMQGRTSPPATETKKILTMEYNVDLTTKQIPAAYPGGPTSYHALYDWVRYSKCDMFWILAGQTTGWHSSVNKDNPWMSGPKSNAEILAASTNKGDVKFGAYIMSYFTDGGGHKKAGYEVATGYSTKTKSMGSSRHVSLGSEARLNDIINLLKEFDANENISYLGLDFIRTGEMDGFELVDEMVALTGVYTPKNWANMSKYNRMLWLAQMRLVNREIGMKWRWYRAQKVANIVKSIKDAGVKKPLWVFTLGWDHGQEHGQDPYMFFDAGVDFDAIMIYEATRPQHRTMLTQWGNYLAGEYNVLVGNMVDNRMQDGHKRAELEYMRRTFEAELNYNRISRIRGVFFHDLSRMLWSKNRGRTGVKEWANLNANVVSRIEEKYNEVPITLHVTLNEKSRTGILSITNITKKDIRDIDITPVVGVGLNSIVLDNGTVSLKGKESVNIPFRYTYHSSGASSSLITFRAKTPDGFENVITEYTLLANLGIVKPRAPKSASTTNTNTNANKSANVAAASKAKTTPATTVNASSENNIKVSAPAAQQAPAPTPAAAANNDSITFIDAAN